MLIRYYNGGVMPAMDLLSKSPELVIGCHHFSILIVILINCFVQIHRIQMKFGNDIGTSHGLFTRIGFNWKEMDAVHLMIGQRRNCNDQFAFIQITKRRFIMLKIGCYSNILQLIRPIKPFQFSMRRTSRTIRFPSVKWLEKWSKHRK